MQVRNVHFIDSVPKNKIKTYFDAADIGTVIFVPYPILNTNSANKFFDYLASGLPVLTNYEGWQQIYLEEYNCGFSSKEAFKINEKILALYYNNELLIEMGKNARLLACSKFDRKDVSKQQFIRMGILKLMDF